MRVGRFSSVLAMAAMLASCGGGGGTGTYSSGGGTPAPSPAPSATPAPTADCSIAARKQWTLTQLNEWYLFPDLLASATDPAPFSALQPYIDALVAPAVQKGVDRQGFTYITSIAEENAYYQTGSSAGFGLEFAMSGSRLLVLEAYEGAPGLAAGIDRGDEIVAIGTSTSNLQTVASLMASGGSQAVGSALGPSTVGTTRVLQVRKPDSTLTTVSVAKRDFNLDPVSPRYGAKIIDDGGKKVGYLNLRTFIIAADPQLRAAFDLFKSQGVTEVIVDLRYNGGGLVSIATLIGDLLSAQRAGQVQSYTTYRASKSDRNQTTNFGTQPQAIAATKIAFIGTGWTASASEFVINAQKPYLGTNMALIGSNTYGKPVGQVALDRPACDDRLRAIAFRTENSAREGDYYQGLASKLPRTCQAGDDISRPLGDPQEQSVRVALDFLAGRTCTPIQSASGAVQLQRAAPSMTPLESAAPNAAQRDIRGLF